MASEVADPRTERIAELTKQLLEALGYQAYGDLERTPQRVADLWTTQLVKPPVDIPTLLKVGASPPEAQGLTTPVAVANIGVHLVCPHHLTVAFGRAHVAYTPGKYVLGFGTIGRLVEHLTSRLVLQERATQDIADALVTHAAATAATVCIEATHPCHNVARPRSHDAVAITWAVAGDEKQHDTLRATLTMARTTPAGR
jgi:GTP cyclohydrolase I